MKFNIFELYVGYTGTRPMVDTWASIKDGYLEITQCEANPNYPGYGEPMYLNDEWIIWTK